jgi:hypothetical protein
MPGRLERGCHLSKIVWFVGKNWAMAPARALVTSGRYSSSLLTFSS